MLYTLPVVLSFFIFESVKYTHLSRRTFPFQNKQIMRHLHHLGFGHFGQPCASWDSAGHSVCVSPLASSCREVGYNTDGYSTRWILGMNQGLSLSQGLNVCVGLHIAFLETTQVPQACLNLSAALYLSLNISLWDQGHKFNTSGEPVPWLAHTCRLVLLITLQRLLCLYWNTCDERFFVCFFQQMRRFFFFITPDVQMWVE